MLLCRLLFVHDFSNVFPMGGRSAIGLYDVPIDLSLLYLGNSIIFAFSRLWVLCLC